MSNSNTNTIFPVKFFMKNKSLYVKNSFNHIDEIMKEIFKYSVYIDKCQIPHICVIDLYGVLHYYTFVNNTFVFINKFKLDISIKKIKNFSLYTLNNSLNIFFHVNIDNKLSNIYHINFDFYSDIVSQCVIKNVARKLSNYKIKIVNNHLICYYNSNSISLNSLIILYFNDLDKLWKKSSISDTIHILFKFCNGLKYE